MMKNTESINPRALQQRGCLMDWEADVQLVNLATAAIKHKVLT